MSSITAQTWPITSTTSFFVTRWALSTFRCSRRISTSGVISRLRQQRPPRKRPLPSRPMADEFTPRTTDLGYERRGPIAIVTFNRPDARNAMTWDMYQALYDACEHVDRDDRVRVLVLRGAGDKAFVAGTDISQFKTFDTPEDALTYERNNNRYSARLETLKKPTIAMIRGACVGGGAAFALACDMRIASPD